ncbi:uncharacterized protein LOC131613339 [Vicia villosa]|uniref:uncharacterized protein LOC131613339 n=1 Tax=Vicia villosa TaxID=3911 RepID=UPI00273B5B13|nr:uncharacterized protein LOC131613339 [Vicia villosa]
MGFGEVWMSWMEAMIFSSHMSVIVNGSPTKDFRVERGLCQGDPISPLLYVIVAECLKWLINKEVENGIYAWCSVYGKGFIDVLQFAEDTLMVEDGSWNHLWAIKWVLTSFHLISGLGINFHKSKLIGINLSENFLEVARSFLAFKREDNAFSFLGIPVGHNPRKLSTWSPLVQKIKRRLQGWKSRYLSLGGRITLLKAVLGSLAIFTLSFYRAPKKEISIASMGGWHHNNWIWSDYVCNGPAADSDSVLAARVTSDSGDHVLASQQADKARWLYENNDRFSVSSCYNAINSVHIPFGPMERNDLSYKLIWKMEVPMKAFSWRCFKNRLPTRVGFEHRGIISNSNNPFSFCGLLAETIDHLFLECVVATLVWKDMAEWIGWKEVKFDSLKDSYMKWHRYCNLKKVRKGKEGVLWMAICWNMWLVRNGIVFRNDSWNINDIVWSSKILAWRWIVIGKISLTNCNFDNFNKDPMFFLS